MTMIHKRPQRVGVSNRK